MTMYTVEVSPKNRDILGFWKIDVYSIDVEARDSKAALRVAKDTHEGCGTEEFPAIYDVKRKG